MNFKPGDKVICLHEFICFTKGQVYEVIDIHHMFNYTVYVKNCDEHEVCLIHSTNLCDATKYLHDKEFNSKLQDLINE